MQLGKLAQEKSPTVRITEFGATMVTDHSAAYDKIKAIATKNNMALPTSPSVGQMATKKLEVLSGTTFDESYIKGRVKEMMSIRCELTRCG
jgi:putative membrane protein